MMMQDITKNQTSERNEKQRKTAREIIEQYDGPPVRIMEVCGTHTHEIFRLGIRKLLPKQVELISGPGCPVCVTPVGFIDEAVYLALEKQVTICTFGDLVRVPGTKKSLADARAEGARQEKRAQRSRLFIHRQMQKNMRKSIQKSRWYFFPLALRPPRLPAVFP